MKMKRLFIASVISLMAFQAATAQTTINLNVTDERRQTVTGFGAAALEHLMRPIDEVSIIRTAYEPESPIGLNIMRIEMSPNTKGDITAADIGWDTPYDWHGYLPAVREAKSHGALILATPWSPPAAYKTNNSATGGQENGVHGKLKTSSYSSLFTWFNTFLNYMQSNDASVDVVALQNEPDWWVSYSGCEYTPEEMRDLVKQYGHRLNKERFGVRLLGGEPLGFSPDYYKAMMEDEEAAQYIDLLGGHVYGSYDCKKNLAKAVSYAAGREVWMTEHTVNPRGDNGGPRDLPTWHEQLEFCEDVHECLINGATAYIYWYLAKEYGFVGDGTKYDTRPCLSEGNDRGRVLDRGRLMGQFARQLKGATMLTHTTSLQNPASTPGVNQRFEMSAFLKGDSIIVNVIDTLSRDFNLHLTLPYHVDRAHRIQSTEGDIYAESDPEIEAGREFTFSVPARSFTTYIFHVDDERLAVSRPFAQRPVRADEIFSLSGQRLEHEPAQGIYIKGGRKVVR